jgi:U2-associated protein SR140
VVRDNEEKNPRFDFLLRPDSADGQYYRWRSYATAVGEAERYWRERPFQYSRGGVFVVPPPSLDRPPEGFDVNAGPARPAPSDRRDRAESFSAVSPRPSRKRSRSSSPASSRSRSRSRSPSPKQSAVERFAGMTGAQIERLREKERAKRFARLSQPEAAEWRELLRGLELSRPSIKRAMGFAFDKIEAAEQIIEELRDRLILAASPSRPAVKIAGLFLLSDLLHNSASPIKHATDFK